MIKPLTILGNFTLGVLEKTGYAGVFVASLLDRLTVFLIPAEVVLPAYGILISRGTLNFWPVFIWVTAGNFIGNLVLYFIFLKGGRPFLEKYGRYVLISKHDLNHLDHWFSKYGDKIVFFGYLIPTAARSLVPIPAGVTGMKVGKFSLYTFIGSLPLNLLYIYIGMKAGDNYFKILNYFEKINYVVIGALAVLIAWYIYRHIKHRHATHA